MLQAKATVPTSSLRTVARPHPAQAPYSAQPATPQHPPAELLHAHVLLRATATVHAPWSALLSSLHDGPYMMDVALMMPWKPEGMPLA